MSKQKNNLFLIVLFSSIWVLHPISSQETTLMTNSSSTSTQTDELEINAKKVMLVKETTGGSSFFAESFTPPLPKRSRSTVNQPAMGMSGLNPGQGGGNPNPNSGSEIDSCPSDPIPKNAPEVVSQGLGYSSKTKRQKALEKMKRELRESIEVEDKINAQRKKQGKTNITVTVKDGVRWFTPNSQLRDKFHHAPDLDSPLPLTLSRSDLARLSNPRLYKERLEIFRNETILPEAFVEQSGRDLRLHILDPDTTVIAGTLGANLESNGGPPRIEGYHLYNDKTGFDAFYDKNGRQYRTGMILNRGQRIDLRDNNNIM